MNEQEKIVLRQQAILAAAKAENRDLNADERAEFDQLQERLMLLKASENSEGTENPGESGENNEATRQSGVPGENVSQLVQRGIADERRRAAEITALCRDFHIEPDQYIQDGKTIEEVRTAVLDHLKRNGAPVPLRVISDEGDKFRERASDALMMRSGQEVKEPAEGARQLMGMSLRDLAVECLAREGENISSLVRMDRSELYYLVCRQFYNPTSAFPAILDSTIRKSIVHVYNHVPTTFEFFTTKGSLSDFKETADHEYILGGLGDFELVPENGEIKADKLRTEKLPGRKLNTYAKQFSMTRQAFINDDIGFLTEVPGQYAMKAKKTIDKQVYLLLFNNKVIFDGKRLFCEDHNNLMATASEPTQTSIQDIILQMQSQKDPFGDAIYITPKTIIVPVGYEFKLAVIFNSSQVPGSNYNDYNPMRNYPLNVVQSPMLNAFAKDGACPWFMAADPSSVRGIQVDYLNGQEMPMIRRMETPGTLGFVWDVYTDWGITVRDFRGLAMNPGVPLKAEVKTVKGEKD